MSLKIPQQRSATPQPERHRKAGMVPKRDGEGPPDDRGVFSDHAYGHAGAATGDGYGMTPPKPRAKGRGQP